MAACQKTSLTSISGRMARSSPASRAGLEVAGQSVHVASEPSSSDDLADWEDVDSLAASCRRSAPFAHAALVNGSAGIVVTADGGHPPSVMAFTFAAGKITEIYILADRSRPTRLGRAPPGNSTGKIR
jgi:hypothetical protein